MELIQVALTGLALLGCIGLFFGIGLALAAHRFKVETNPLIDEVLEVLPKANCGGCGYPGCEGYAQAVVENPDVAPNLCFPGKEAVGEKVAALTHKEMAKVENSVARVRCSRQDGNVSHKHYYIGFESCAAANIAYGGPSKCQYACIGMGDCVRACRFQAIEMIDHMPHINPLKCVGCGACARTCPKKVIEIQSADARVYVPCASQDKLKAVMDVCEAGCISCGACIKKCPAHAISIVDNKISIDAHLCSQAKDCNMACVQACAKRKILRPVPDKNSFDIFAKVRQNAKDETKSDDKPKAIEAKSDEKVEVAKADKKEKVEVAKAEAKSEEKAEVAKAEAKSEEKAEVAKAETKSQESESTDSKEA